MSAFYFDIFKTSIRAKWNPPEEGKSKITAYALNLIESNGKGCTRKELGPCINEYR